MDAQKGQHKAEELVRKKLELVSQIRDLRAQVGKLNLDLHRAGVDSAIIASW